MLNEASGYNIVFVIDPPETALSKKRQGEYYVKIFLGLVQQFHNEQNIDIFFAIVSSFELDVNLKADLDAHNITIIDIDVHYRLCKSKDRSLSDFVRQLKNPTVIVHHKYVRITGNNELFSLFLEFGIFSRSPSITTHQFDPVGLHARSSLPQSSSFLISDTLRPYFLEVAEAARNMIEAMAEKARSFLMSSAPEDWTKITRTALVVLPRDTDNTVCDAMGGSLNVTEMLSQIIYSNPGIERYIVTCHPDSKAVNDDNCIIDLNGTACFFVGRNAKIGSTELINYCTHVYTVNSMVGPQARIAGRFVYCAKYSATRGFANSLFELRQDRELVFERVDETLGLEAIGMILSLLHPPKKIWEDGYFKFYIEHLMSHKEIGRIATRDDALKYVEKVKSLYVSHTFGVGIKK